MAIPKIFTISVTPTVDTNAYASGDLLGTLMKFKSPEMTQNQRSIIQSLALVDLAKQDISVDIVFFESNPSATTFTDNAALDIADADIKKIIHVESLTSYKDFSDNSIAVSQAMTIPTTYTDSIYACIVSRGAGTYAASDITLKLSLIQE